MDQICQDCRRFVDINAAAFAWDGVGNAEFGLFSEKNAANIEDVEELICFISEDENGRKVFIKITDLIEKKTSLIGLLTCFVFWFVPKTIITKFYWN